MTGFILVLYMLADGTEMSCEANTTITFLPPTFQEVVIEDCSGERLQCMPQEKIFYFPDERTIDLGMCIDIIFKDGFEERIWTN